jgi:hypothetical protein
MSSVMCHSQVTWLKKVGMVTGNPHIKNELIPKNKTNMDYKWNMYP